MTSVSAWENRSALGGTRTPNLLIRSQMLYPLSYERGCVASLRHLEPVLCQPGVPTQAPASSYGTQTPLDHDRVPPSPLDEYRSGRPSLYAAGMAGDMPCGICGPLRFGLVGDA